MSLGGLLSGGPRLIGRRHSSRGALDGAEIFIDPSDPPESLKKKNKKVFQQFRIGSLWELPGPHWQSPGASGSSSAHFRIPRSLQMLIF